MRRAGRRIPAAAKAAGALAALVALAIGGGAWVVYSGWYDISATSQHLRATYRVLDTALRASIQRRAAALDVPSLDDPALADRGLALFRAHCVQCHGAPGVAPEPFALGLTPMPASLVHTARRWSPAELFQAIKHGIKMTGMPAWAFRLSDDEIWAVVAFMRVLPALSPRQYAALPTRAGTDAEREPPGVSGPPDPQRGRVALRQYLCLTCHHVPGVVGPNAPVGPPLDGIATRSYLAGRLQNTPENLVRWIREPQAVSPGSAMPDLGVTEADARDMVAYLSTLRR